jgi:DNA-binding NtrC family response regulator
MLAIDDQQMILDLLMGICQSVGIELTAVREPAEGVALFKRGHFDVVMVDLALGQVSGWDIAGEIKRHAPETPVILMTGWGMNIGPEDAARAGVDFTLSKPFRIEQLTDIILQAKTRLLSR